MVDSSSPHSFPSVLLALAHKPSRELLSDRLRRDESRVECVEDGTEAQRRIENHAFEVVVVETRLPGRTGLELLRSFPLLRPPFVLVGRRGNDDEVTRAFELGAADYVTLPFSPRIATARILRVPRLVSAVLDAGSPSQ